MTAIKNCNAELRTYLFQHKLPEVFEVYYLRFCLVNCLIFAVISIILR